MQEARAENSERWREDHAALRAAFTQSGVVGANLQPIDTLEESFELYVTSEFRGYRLMHQSFLSFLAESLGLAGEHLPPPDGKWALYRPLLVFVGGVFSRLRAAEVLYLHGYPWDAYSLLRDLKERAMLLAGMLSGYTSIDRVLGISGDANDPTLDYYSLLRAMAQRRRQEHARVRLLMTGRRSGLPEDVQRDLRNWGELFHAEVHLSQQSYVVDGLEPYRRTGHLQLGPQKSLAAATMYMNRSIEIIWCLHRTVPILQPQSRMFRDDWHRKWEILDDCLRRAVEALAEQGKELIPSVITWVQAKFAFDTSWSYANGLSDHR